MEYTTDRVIVNLAMVKVGDLILEIEELTNHQATLMAELKQLMADWAETLK